MSLVDVVEYTDPHCVWSWSSEPKLRWLQARYGEQLRWRRVFGIQVDDIERVHPGVAADAVAATVLAGIRATASQTGAPSPPSLPRAARSSRPASLVAKAAEAQGPALADAVLRRLREALFVEGRPADGPDRLAEVLHGVPGLDVERALADADSAEVHAAIERDHDETRRPDAAVIGRTGPGPHPGAARPDGDRLRYGFPTLVVRGSRGRRVLPGWQPVEAYDDAVREVEPGAGGRAVWITAEAALERYRSLTARDLDLLTGSIAPPEGAVAIPTPTGVLYRHPDHVRPPLAALQTTSARSER